MVRSKLLAAVTHIGRRAAKRKFSLAFSFLGVFVVIPVCLYILLGYTLADDPRLVPYAFRNARNVLLVTAHPDDECLFFSPSILQSWGKEHVNRAILVLSSGNIPSCGLTDLRPRI